MSYVESTLTRVLCVLFVLLCVNAYAADCDLGITRGQVMQMLTEEGLSPSINPYPPIDGEPYDEAIVPFPWMTVGMLGPDDGLTSISLSLKPSANATNAYWQGFVSLWILTAAFPDWEHKEEWLNRTIQTMADGGSNDKVEFQRGNYNVGAAMAMGFFHLEIWCG